jgi:hypothetical protein
MKKRLVGLIAAVVVAVPLFSGSQAEGLTAWKTFGTAAGKGIGQPDGNPFPDLVWVGAQSTTNAFPKRIRIVATGPSQGKAEIRWSFGCWNGPGEFRGIDGFVVVRRLPLTIDLSNRVGGVWNWKWCDPDVVVIYPADGFTSAPGAVKLQLQARYG